MPLFSFISSNSDDLPWTFLRTYSAVCTFFRINMGKEITYSNSSCLTVFLTETAADTSHLTYFHQRFSFFIGIALNKSLLLIRDQLDQMFWTCSNTFSTCLACLLVYNSNTINYMDCIKRTRLDTAPVPETSVGTSLCTAILHLGLP